MMRRSYSKVGVGENGDSFAVTLDGAGAKTSGGALLLLPTRPLAEAVAEEWRGQRERLDPATMMLTRLAYAAIDQVGPARGQAIGHALAFGRSDVLCYRVERPEALAERQRQTWNPLLEWARAEFGLRLIVDEGIASTQQPADALLRMQELTAGMDDFRLAAFDAAATGTCSFVLALALVKRHLGAEHAFAAAQLEELFQAETWGRDTEAEAWRTRLRAELGAVERFIAALVAE